MPIRENNLLRLVTAPSESVSLLAQGLVHLAKAVKGAAFYPESHPYRTEPLQRAFEAFRQLVAERELVLTVSRQGISPGGEGADSSHMVRQLAHECFIHRIANITFLPDLLPADLEVFVDLLSGDPYRTSSNGGFARQMEEAGARTVWINEKDIAAIWAKRSSPVPQPRDAGSDDACSDDAMTALESAGWLRDEQGERSVEELLRLMSTERRDVRYQELGRQLVDAFRDAPPGTDVLPVLMELLRHHQDQKRSLPQREYALFTLERIADGAAETLLGLVESRDCQDKESIHRIFAALAARGAYLLIQRLCLAEGVFERKALAVALVRIGSAAVTPVIAMLKDERWYVVRNMVAILGELRSADAVLALKRPLRHDDVRVRKEAVRALMKIGGEPAEATLVALLEEPDEMMVRHAALSLGLMKSRLAVPTLLKVLERRDLFLKGLGVKKELLAALGRIGDRRATAPLLKQLKARNWAAPVKAQELKAAAASALGSLGDEAALAILTPIAAGAGIVAEACREAVDAIERVSGEVDD